MGKSANHISFGGKKLLLKIELINPQSIYFSNPSIVGEKPRTKDQIVKIIKNNISSNKIILKFDFKKSKK